MEKIQLESIHGHEKVWASCLIYMQFIDYTLEYFTFFA